MKEEFVHCLRVQFYPGHYEEERIESIANFCLQYGFKNIMLFINSEEYHRGHMTIEEAKPWVATMKRAKQYFVERGLTVSLNPWIEIGHLARGRTLKPGQNFTTMVDYNGKKDSLVACPLCENWRRYYFSFYRYLLTELEPDTVWVEDDFRLHNHGDLAYGGCFCDLHMEKFNEQLGTHYTREEFTDRLFRKNPSRRVRKAWLDVNRACMVDLAGKIGEVVAEASPGTRVGLMSSAADAHAMEGRDWHGIFGGLSPRKAAYSRLHLPCYEEFSAKRYYHLFQQVPYVCRAFLPKDAIVYPEIECDSFNTYAKEPTFMRFQIESAIPLCIKGMTYDICDFVGNGANESFGYGTKIKEITPYLNGVLNLHPDFDSAEGVILPVDEKTVYHRGAEITRFDDLWPDEFRFGAYLATVGMNTKVSVKKRFVNRTVALAEGNVYNFSDAQLRALFRDNRVILEGGAAKVLIDRGLGDLISARTYTEYKRETGIYSFEEIAGDKVINGVHGYRADADRVGDYVSVAYENGTVRSYVCNPVGERVGTGIFDGGNFLVLPYRMNAIRDEHYNDLRTTLLKDWLRGGQSPLVLTNHAGVYAYLFRQNKRYVLMTVNSTEEDFDTTDLELIGIDVSKIRRIDRKTGKIVRTAFEREGRCLRIKNKNEHLSTNTFLLN